MHVQASLLVKQTFLWDHCQKPQTAPLPDTLFKSCVHTNRSSSLLQSTLMPYTVKCLHCMHWEALPPLAKVQVQMVAVLLSVAIKFGKHCKSLLCGNVMLVLPKLQTLLHNSLHTSSSANCSSQSNLDNYRMAQCHAKYEHLPGRLSGSLTLGLKAS